MLQKRSSGGHVIVFVFFLLFPLIILPQSLIPDPWADGKFFIMLATALFFATQIKLSDLKTPFFLLIIAQLILYSISCIISSQESFIYLFGLNNREDGIVYNTTLSIFMMGIYSYFSRNKIHAQNIYLPLTIVFLIEFIYFVLRLYNIDIVALFLTGGGRFPDFVGTFGNYGIFAYFTILCYIIFLVKSFTGDRRFIIPLFLSVLIIVFTYNRTIIASFLLANIVFVVFYKKKWWFLLAIAALVAILVPVRNLFPANNNLSTGNRSIVSSSTLQTRLAYWGMALDIAQKTPFQPLLGLGNTGMILGQIRYIDTERIARAYLLEENINEELVAWEKKPSESGIEALGVLYITTKTASGQNLTRFFKYNTDRAHNFFLDKTVAGGLIYAIILFFIILYPMVYFRQLKHDLLYLVYFLCTVATFAFYMFWFPFLQTEPIFMILVAIGWAKIQKTKEARIHLVDSTGDQKITSEGPKNE